jgi:hypothetical protein
LLRRDIFLSLCKSISRSPILKRTLPLFSVSKNPLHVLGEAHVSLAGGTNWPWVIVENIPYGAILGADLLQHVAADLDFHSNTITMSNVVLPLTFDDNLPPAITSLDSPLLTLLDSYQDVFHTPGEPIKPCLLSPLVIDTGNSLPVHQRPYRTPLAKRATVEAEIEEMLRLGFIRPSASPYAAPMLLVPKKDQSWRVVIDFRRLNLVSKMDRHPLPLIQDIFDQLGGSTVFTTLDLKQGYHQLPVHPDSIEKTAFSCHLGLFEWTRMPMGVSCGPPVFQREMQKAMAGLLGVCCLVYLDDLVIFSRDPKDHVRHVGLVFARLRQYGLSLKRSKCRFAAPVVELLGFVISAQGISVNPEKVAAIASLPPPTSVKEVRGFLGMTGYYRQTVNHYAEVAEPLVALTRKRVPFSWSAAQQGAFDSLKQTLLGDAVMAFPRSNHPYLLYTDASDFACGAILCQTDENGLERVIQYVSHQLAGAQLRWATIEKEAFAVVYALKKLRPYLLGSDFCIYTDHKPLVSLFSSTMQNAKIQRWAIMVSEYGAKILFRPGKDNTRADMLSRIRLPPPIATIDTHDWLDAEWAHDDALARVPLTADGLDHERVRAEQMVKFPDLFLEAEDQASDYEIHEGLLYSTRLPSPLAAPYPRLVLPPCFRVAVVKRAHEAVGHMGSAKTLHRTTDAYVWPGMKGEIRRLTQNCPTCTIHTARRQHTPMGDMPLPVYPAQFISTDLTGPLPESPAGNKYILSIFDLFSGWVDCYPLPDKRSATVSKCFTDDYFPRAGFPEKLLCDNGGEFNHHDFRSYLAHVGVEQINTTPVHPQSNGKIERFHRTMKEMLRKLCNGDRPKWQSQLPQALAAYRNAVSTVTGYTPFFLYYGRRARVPLATVLPEAAPPPNLLGNRLADMTDAFRQAKEHTEQSRFHNRERLARKATAGEIVVGDSVIVAANEPVSLSAKWDHQYEVTKSHGTTFWVRHQRTMKELKVHRDKLRLVDPNMLWDDVAPRPRRQFRRRANVPLPQAYDADAVANELPVAIMPRPLVAPVPPLAPPPRPAPAIPPVVAPQVVPACADPRGTQLTPPPAVLAANAAEPMDEAPPPCHYFLRKRAAAIAAPTPDRAKRLRIDCLAFAQAWFSPAPTVHTIDQHDGISSIPPLAPPSSLHDGPGLASNAD